MRAIRLFLIAVVMALVSQGSASADAYPDCDRGKGVCRPDANPDHWCFGPGTKDRPVLRSAMQWAISNANNTTDINTSPMKTCTGAADARWREGGSLNDYVLGQYQCTDWAGASHPDVCYSSDVIINVSAHHYFADDLYGEFSVSDGKVEPGEIELNLKISACHELGHHLGLMHHELSWYRSVANDCMRSPWLERENPKDRWLKYNQHHRDHINSFY